MEFKLAAKAAAAWPSPAHALALRGETGGSRVGFAGFGSAATGTKALRLRAASNSATPVAKEGRVDQSETVTLGSIRQTLIKLEDSIIFCLLERAQYRYNADTYDSSYFHMDGFEGSLVEYMVRETEKLHVQVLHPIADSININKKIWNLYFDELLPRFAKEGSDGNYGSSALCDTSCLQALSKRIHNGKFVAEAKFQQSPEAYRLAIEAQDPVQLMELLTFETVERAVEQRVEVKAKIFGQDVSTAAPPARKIDPSLVAGLYRRIMPLTKEVQVAYLLGRLD
ncbi:unnamed protein product [Urochloa decumbens]|uniref:chorismate mutase n=1 Tax=Urochloa decumbens TaxID=240449 RepID=A0ABC9C1N9_9POAL